MELAVLDYSRLISVEILPLPVRWNGDARLGRQMAALGAVDHLDLRSNSILAGCLSSILVDAGDQIYSVSLYSVAGWLCHR